MFLELCTKYGEFLQKNSDFNIVDNLLKIDYSGDYETDINKYIYNTLFKKNWNASNLTLSLLPKSFQERYPKLFLLNEEVPDEIRKKYLNRELYLQDFIDNSELLIYFKNVNIYNGLNVDSGEREIVELYLNNRGTYDYSLINNNIIFLLKAYRNYQTINITTIINTIIQEEDKLLNDSIIEEYIYDYYVNRGNNSIKIPVENFRYDYNVLLDDINYNYYGKIDGDVQSFKFNNSDYYKLKDDYYVNNGTWIKTNNPYKFYELIDFDNINKILENASFISKDNESKKTTYKYLISSNTINKLVYGVDTDYDEVPNQVSVELSNGGISKIEMRLDSLCKLNNVCQKSLTLDLNYELYNSVSQIDNPIE